MAAKRLIKSPDVKLISASGKVVDKFEPGCSLEYEGKLVPLTRTYGGLIVSTDDSNLLVDDPYITKLYKAGYIVYKNYDKERSDFPASFTDKMYQKYSDALYSAADLATSHAPQWGGANEIWLQNENDFVIFRLNRVIDIVEMNKKRKDNDLTFYPFNKDMDKNATLYLSVFYKRKKKNATYPKALVDSTIKESLIMIGADYHFSSMPVRGMVAKWEGI